MSNDRVGAPGDLQPQVEINFNLRASLSRTMSAPVIIDGIVGLAVFGNSSEIYLAHIPDKGGEVYERLGSVKATTYIHGWTVHLGKLYVLDGVELAMWDLSEGKKGAALNLVKEATDIAQAKTALDGLKNAIQRVEWATLLEQAEDEWVRLTEQQSKAAPDSAERDRLDTLAADYFLMLKTLRELTGSTGGAVAARTIVKTLRAELAKKRKEVAPWCFSPPVIRQGNFDQPQRAVFVVQGNGTLYTCDKSLTQSSSKKWREKAEPTIALMEDLKLLACISDNALRTVDTTTFAEKGSWTPEKVPAEGAKHILAWANKQLWWSTEAGVQGCEVDAAGNLKPTFRSGQPWTTRQVGRLGVLPTSYDPIVNPNDLFDRMNINAWIAKRPKEAGPLNDGIIAHLMLSDENGKYSTPAEGFSHIVHGPFAADARSAGHGWTQVKAHALKPLVILSDSRGASVLCKYPTPAGVSQMLPQWSVIPWLSSVSAHSDLERELSREWPTPQRRPAPKPFPDMGAYLKSSPLSAAAIQYENLLSLLAKDRRKIGDRDLRFLIWHGLFNRPFPSQFYMSQTDLVKDLKKLLYLFFNDADQQLMRNRFMTSGTWATGGHNNEPGTVWDWVTPDNSGYLVKFFSGFPPVDFDPPWAWKTPPTNLFHSAPPAWYDPWGYNRPGDFFPNQPSANYLMPFCFDGNVRFPQRPITFEGTFKGRSWAMFTDNDPTSILASAKPATRETERQDPVLLQASNEPSVLVVTADDDHQRTNFQLLATRPARITFDVFTHTLRQDMTVLGSNGNDVMGSPTVYKARSRTFPTAWCVVNAEFASARLRKLAAVDPDTGVSPWIEFVEDNVAQYGPKDGGKAWQIDKCPLPQTALPTIWLHGYNLPASS
jgi:hypothetical protein